MSAVTLSPGARAATFKPAHVERFRADDRAAWLKRRQDDVTASVAGALLGVHEYQTAYGLWALKSGLIAEDPEESQPMRRGRLLEPVALQVLREDRPTWQVEPCGFYYRDPVARIGATPDALAVDPEREGFGVIQVKSVEPGIYRRKWRNAEGEVEPPLWIVVQAIIESALSGASWAAVAPLVMGHGVELPVVAVPLHAGIMDRLKAEVAHFWRLVEAGTPPDPDYARDGALLEWLFDPVDDMVDLSSDNGLPALLDERETLSASKGEAEKRLKAIKTELLVKIGPHAAATVADGRTITAKRVTRKPYAVEETSFVDVRVKAAKQDRRVA